MAETNRAAEVKRVGRFGVVGIANTIIDYLLFIGLTKALSLPLSRVWIAKFLSGSVAMAFSFVLNKTWVFERRQTGLSAEAAKFLAVTAFGVYVIQLGLVQFFSSVWPAVGQRTYALLSHFDVFTSHASILTQALVIKTVAFALATLASLSWNYLAYKKVVFK